MICFITFEQLSAATSEQLLLIFCHLLLSLTVPRHNYS